MKDNVNPHAFVDMGKVKDYSKAYLPKNAELGEHTVDMGTFQAVWTRIQKEKRKTWQFDGIRAKHPIQIPKDESPFEKKMMQSIEHTILKQIKEVYFVDRYPKYKKQVSQSLVEKVWENLDWDIIHQEVSKELQERIASNIVQSMLVELKTDVKSILSVQGVRQKLKMNAYPVIMKVLNEEL